MIEIPPKFSGFQPVNPDVNENRDFVGRKWKGAEGLAEDVRYYGKWVRSEAEKRIGNLYPKAEITSALAEERPDLQKYVGQKLTVIAWLWARTVKSPNPAFANIDVPLASTFMLSTKPRQEAYVEPVVDGNKYHFNVKMGVPKDVQAAKKGTKLARGANFRCLVSGSPMAPQYIKAEGRAGRMGARLFAMVVQGDRERLFLPPTKEHAAAALQAKPEWKPDLEISGSSQYLGVRPYGTDRFSQLFTARQLVSLTTISDLIAEVPDRVKQAALAAGLPDDNKSLAAGGEGATAYAEAIAVYLAFAFDKLTTAANTMCTWQTKPTRLVAAFSRQVFPMTWDYAESNAFGGAAGDYHFPVQSVTEVMLNFPEVGNGFARQQDAQRGTSLDAVVVSTDPPYFDNVPYADLSDFFYIWLRRSMRNVFPDLFATLAVPKAEELVAFAYRHEDKASAEAFFLDGMAQAMRRLAEKSHPAFPVTIYYAFKQSETDDAEGTTNTGWDTFLAAVMRAGFAITGTWPMRTELTVALKKTKGVLASSIVLVCRQHAANAPVATRREFIAALKAELPSALAYLQAGNIAPVDLAQAAIGPGMAVYTRYSKVLDAEGNPLAMRAALALINQTLDEALAEQEGDFDADSRWALAWFEQAGFAEGEYGVAETLSKAKNTSVAGLVEAGILASKGGRVRLLKPDELPPDWDPETDSRLTSWEVVHQLIRALEAGGEIAAADLAAGLTTKAEAARELCYRLYTICERKKRAAEALSYNGLVQSWPEIMRLAGETRRAPGPSQGDLL